MFFLAATPTPTEPVIPPADRVTPGLVGFLAIFFVAVATIFLIRDMVKRVRRVRAKDNAQTEYRIPIRRTPGARDPQEGREDAESDVDPADPEPERREP